MDAALCRRASRRPLTPQAGVPSVGPRGLDAVAAQSYPRGEPMPTQQTMPITDHEQRWVDALNRGDIAVADETFTRDCVIHITGSPHPELSLPEFKQMVTGLLAAFPDLHFTIEDQITSGDKVATRWIAEGTHTAPFGEIPPTGRRVHVDGLILDRLENGKVVERWEQWDQMAMMRQLGLV